MKDNTSQNQKLKLATLWLDGCSGCHMSFLDMDERLIELKEKADIVFSPYVDFKKYPDQVDAILIEGAVGSTDDLAKLRKVREHTKIIVAFGDCAVTGNVSSMRNPFGTESILRHAYLENADRNISLPLTEDIPPLLENDVPLHEYVHVDVFIPGCPPPADAIYYALKELAEGRIPSLSELTRFGK